MRAQKVKYRAHLLICLYQRAKIPDFDCGAWIIGYN